MYNKDHELIESMKMPVKQTINIDIKDRTKYNSMINRILNYIRGKDKACTLSEINREFPEFELKRNKEFLSYLKICQKIHYEEKTDIIVLKSKYNIKNIEELKHLIRISDNGIPENEELKDSYPGIRTDLDILKGEKYIIQIYNDERKENILFYRDMSDPTELILTNEKYKDAIEEIRKIWKKGLENFENFEDPKLYIGKKKKFKPSKNKKNDKVFKKGRIANVHLLELNKDDF
jgi:hypothetical protein